jgi:hypothetical protein
MAITKTIEIDVNTLQAVGGLDNLDKALKKVDNSVKSVDASFEEVYGDLKPLTARMGEAEDRLYELALAGQSASQEYKDLLASVGNYRKVQMQTDMVVDAAATTFDTKLGGALQGATSAFAGVQGAMALTGGQSEELEKALLKVQGAMALAEGVRGVREGAVAFKALSSSAQKFTIVQKAITAGQWLWNTAMAANPIGAIIAAVVALIAAGVALTNYFMENSKAAKANAAAVELNRVALEKQSKTLESNSDAFDKKQKQELAMAKASGMSVEAIRKLELKLADEKIAYEKSQRAIAENTYEKEQNILASLRASGADDDVIKKQIENRNEAVKQYNKQNQDVKKALDEKADIQNRHLVEIKTAETSSAKDKSAKDKERRQKEIDDQKKQYEDAKKIAEDAKIQNENAGKTELELLEDKFKKEKAILEKNKIDTNELEIKYWNERNGILLKQQEEEKKVKDKEKEDKLKEDEDKRLKDQEQLYKDLELKKEFDLLSFEEQRNLLTERENTITNDQTLTEEQRTTLKQQYADARIKIDELEAQAKAKMVAAIGQTLATASELLGKNTVAGKAMAIAATTVDTLQSSISAYKGMVAAIPGPVGIAAGAVAAAGSIATGLATVKKIVSVKVPGGGGGGSAPSISASSVGTPAPAPSFNVVGNSGVNQIAQTLGNQQPVQAYVVANNVTTAQSLDRNIVQNASLG